MAAVARRATAGATTLTRPGREHWALVVARRTHDRQPVEEKERRGYWHSHALPLGPQATVMTGPTLLKFAGF